ncbi:MAG TPA: TonB C-terminal domain-containing protein [Desulfomonilia bacterium]
MRKFHVFLAISLLLHIGLFAAVLVPDFSSKPKTVPVVYEVDIVPGVPGASVSGGAYRSFSMPTSVPKIKDFGEISRDVPVNDGPSRLPSPDLDSEPARSSGSAQSGQYDRHGDDDSTGGSAYGEVARKDAWIGIVMARFRNVWQIPEGVPIRPDLQATYTIRISSTGDIISRKLLVSSGNRPYDRSVEIALSRIKLPPPPGGRYEWTLSFVPPYSN